MEKERMRRTEGRRDIDLLSHLCMHSLVDSCVCHDQGWSLHPDIRMVLQPMEHPARVKKNILKKRTFDSNSDKEVQSIQYLGH